MSDNTLPQKIAGLSELKNQYDALLCDVWGVIHNGVELFPGVAEALTAWRQAVGPVLLLTNAPRPADTVQQRLDEMGFPRDSYDGILSSGDAARQMLAERAEQGQVCHFVGAAKDVDLLNAIDIDYGTADEADFVLLTGMADDSFETPDDYQAAITQWGVRDLPVICANPDRMVQIGDKVIYCAGALAEIYEQQGGDVIWLGKPHLPIYDTAQGRLQNFTGQENPRVLAVGDGYKTDIPGANAASLDVIFVTGGLAAILPEHPESPAQAASILQDYNAHANYFLKHLVW